jgi:hypothetical protein
MTCREINFVDIFIVKQLTIHKMVSFIIPYVKVGFQKNFQK